MNFFFKCNRKTKEMKSLSYISLVYRYVKFHSCTLLLDSLNLMFAVIAKVENALQKNFY